MTRCDTGGYRRSRARQAGQRCNALAQADDERIGEKHVFLGLAALGHFIRNEQHAAGELGGEILHELLQREDVQLRALLRGKVRDALQQGGGRHPQPGAGDEHDGARIGARPGGRGVVHLLHDPEDIGARGLGDALAAVDGQRNGGGRDTGALGNVLICDLSHKKLLLRAHCAVLYLHYTGTPGRMQEGI